MVRIKYPLSSRFEDVREQFGSALKLFEYSFPEPLAIESGFLKLMMEFLLDE